MSEEKIKEEKPLEEMSDAEIQAVRDEIALEEFGGEKSAGVKTSPEPEPKEEEPEVNPETETEEERPETELESEVEEKEEEDPWAGVSPAVREILESLSTKVSSLDTIQGRLKQAERRLGAIQNEFYAAKKKVEAAKKAVPTQEEIEKAAADEKEWEELKIEYPDWTAAVDARLSKMAKSAEEIRQEQKKLIDYQNEFANQLKSEFATVNEALERRLLSFKHPNWEKTIESPEYQKWIAEQPEDIKEKTYSTKAEDAISVLDKFFEAQKTDNETTTQRKQRLKKSVLPEGTKTKPPKTEAEMTEQELRSQIAKEIWGD